MGRQTLTTSALFGTPTSNRVERKQQRRLSLRLAGRNCSCLMQALEVRSRRDGYAASFAQASFLDPKATAFFSVGPLPPPPEDIASSTVQLDVPLHPKAIIYSAVPSQSATQMKVQSTSMEIQIPCLFGMLSKPSLDGMQLWADDIAQWSDRTFNERERRSGFDSGDPSMIGSRYFTKRPKSILSASTGSGGTTKNTAGVSELIISVSVLEG